MPRANHVFFLAIRPPFPEMWLDKDHDVQKVKVMVEVKNDGHIWNLPFKQFVPFSIM